MKFQFRGCTSLLLTFSFLIMAYSGVILYFPPRGGSTFWSQWFAFGLRKPAWDAIHVNICLLFLIVAILHLIFNWSTFWCYVKKSAGLGLSMKTEMIIALLLAAIVTAGTIYRVPPFSIIRSYGDRQGPPGGRGPGFGRGPGQGEANHAEGSGQGEGQGRQFRGGRAAENSDKTQ